MENLVDLAIGEDFLVENSVSRPIDPYDFDPEKLYSKGKLPYNLSPGERILLTTKETITVPSGYVGVIHLRSTFARLGILDPNTLADPGFSGNVTLEVYNGSKNRIKLRPNDKLFFIVYYAVSGAPEYRGRYQGQEGVTAPRPLIK